MSVELRNMVINYVQERDENVFLLLSDNQKEIISDWYLKYVPGNAFSYQTALEIIAFLFERDSADLELEAFNIVSSYIIQHYDVPKEQVLDMIIELRDILWK